MAWSVYLLRCGDGSLYTGCTNDLGRRLAAHGSGRGAKYTRSRLPVALVYQEAAQDRSAALRRERQIKRMPRAQKIALIKKGGTAMRRKELQTTQEEAWNILDRSHYGVLSMIDADGTPYAVPVNVARDGTAIYFHSAKDGKKADCMRHNPQVCLACVSDEKVHEGMLTTHYASVVLCGTVEEVTDDAEMVSALRTICMRFAPENPRSSGDFKECRTAVSVWKITVKEITGKTNLNA